MLGFYKYAYRNINVYNKCMYKLLYILCMFKILIKVVSCDFYLLVRKMSNYVCWKKLVNNCERVM